MTGKQEVILDSVQISRPALAITANQRDVRGEPKRKLALSPSGQKGVPPQQRQVNESNAREIRERAGHSGIPY